MSTNAAGENTGNEISLREFNISANATSLQKVCVYTNVCEYVTVRHSVLSIC